MEMYAEDTGRITCEMIELMQERLSTFGLVMPLTLENEIFDEIFKRIEFVCPNDYLHQH